ncbi:uncharacterized protein LOC128996670 [Macrosteles quadrilineatus]|uniref:uncharacterized protein LOC128996670 n=1 Tax=Macrosteles quadrilineatus TaxID=74068 RepID=UPI0023E1CBC3|nr:uncharacterized protein LOC128996670 [Macrosteles quadrilineatus]
MDFKIFLQNVLSNHEGVEVKIDSLVESSCTEPGQNFMSVVSIVKVEGKIANVRPYFKSVFVKRKTLFEGNSQLFSMDDAFDNEVVVYLKVLPLIMRTADVTRLPCPSYYHVSNDVIILEDLQEQGFGSGKASEGFDFAAAISIVQELAKFHAASYYTRMVDQERFDVTVKELKPIGLILSNNRSMMETCLKRVIRYIEAEKDMNLEATSLRRLHGRVTESMRELREPKNVAVLVHGDFWYNNILIWKSEDSEDKIRIIDFQASALLSPAVDFWLFLYTSISHSLLVKNCVEFITLYKASFQEALSNLNSFEIPSEELMFDELLSKELYGFLSAMAYLPALYLKGELLGEMTKASEEEKKDGCFLDKFVLPGFKERLIEIVRFAYQRGVFNHIA